MPARSFGPFASDGIPIKSGAKVQVRVKQTSGEAQMMSKFRFGIATLEPKGSGGLLLPGVGGAPPSVGPPLVLGANIAWQQGDQPRAQVRMEVDGEIVIRAINLAHTPASSGAKIAWHPTDNRIVYPYNDSKNYEVFNADAEVLETGWPVPPSSTRAFASAWRPDGSKLLLGVNSSAGIFVVDDATKDVVTGWPDLLAQWCVSWSPNGEQFISGSTGTEGLRLLDYESRSVIMQDTDALAPRALAYSPDGETFAAGAVGYVRAYDADGSLLTDLSPDGAVFSMAWSPLGDRLAVGFGTAPFLRVLDTSDWTWETGWPDVPSTPYQLSWWNDASRLAAIVNSDDRLYVFDTADKVRETGWPIPAGAPSFGVVFINDPGNSTSG